MVRTDPEFINFADELRREEQQDAIIKSKIGTEEDPEIQKQRAIEKRLWCLKVQDGSRRPTAGAICCEPSFRPGSGCKIE